MKYCSNCGSANLAFKIPEGDNLPRYICENCQTIFYQNPKIVTGTLPIWQDKILLCKRAIEPRYGLWTLPAGFMENNETVEQAAIRETSEEAKANVEQVKLYVMISLPDRNQVYMIFRAQLSDLNYAPGIESLDVKLFKKDEIPWNNIAFPVITKTLNYYFDDLTTNEFPLHVTLL
jgi:ADP-ribose pyrophosphatase YjhB (NUDIX family)